MRRVTERVRLVAPHDTPVLLQGESGTGKEVVARLVHRSSPRAANAFVAVNCGALPEALVESELFGHERGSFTGAERDHVGRFERANGGTLFLDEVGELPPAAQVKLLRALQEGEIERIGSDVATRIDTRVVAASNRDLQELVRGGDFREDLFYRLHVFAIDLPPLRERGEDLAALASEILGELEQRLGRGPFHLEPAMLERMRAYAWPGNVRELRNRLESAAIMSRDGSLVLRFDAPGGTDIGDAPHGVETFEAATRRCIARALSACDGRIYGERGAATLLGLKPTTLQSKMRKLGIGRRG